MPRKITRIDGDGNVSWVTPDGDTVRAAVDTCRAHLMNSEVISVQVGCDDHGTRHEGALSDEVLNATRILFSRCDPLSVGPDCREGIGSMYVTKITVASLTRPSLTFNIHIRVLEDVEHTCYQWVGCSCQIAGTLVDPSPRTPMGWIGIVNPRLTNRSDESDEEDNPAAAEAGVTDTDILAIFETQEALSRRQAPKSLQLALDKPLLQDILECANMSFLDESVDPGIDGVFRRTPLFLRGKMTADWTDGDDVDELRTRSLRCMTDRDKEALRTWGPSETVGKPFEMDVGVHAESLFLGSRRLRCLKPCLPGRSATDQTATGRQA